MGLKLQIISSLLLRIMVYLNDETKVKKTFESGRIFAVTGRQQRYKQRNQTSNKNTQTTENKIFTISQKRHYRYIIITLS